MKQAMGIVLAAAVIGETGDIHRFEKAKALVAYAGIDAAVPPKDQFQGICNRRSKEEKASSIMPMLSIYQPCFAKCERSFLEQGGRSKDYTFFLSGRVFS
ncbi:MAG: IS110 family transposase [Firmicutes bacterium]|nr:IS110 family transposase [Bacillota bacterium]